MTKSRGILYKRKCDECGSIFYTAKPHQKRCGNIGCKRSFALKWYYAHKKPAKEYHYNCAVCHKGFIANMIHKKVCDNCNPQDALHRKKYKHDWFQKKYTPIIYDLICAECNEKFKSR